MPLWQPFTTVQHINHKTYTRQIWNAHLRNMGKMWRHAMGGNFVQGLPAGPAGGVSRRGPAAGSPCSPLSENKKHKELKRESPCWIVEQKNDDKKPDGRNKIIQASSSNTASYGKSQRCAVSKAWKHAHDVELYANTDRWKKKETQSRRKEGKDKVMVPYVREMGNCQVPVTWKKGRRTINIRKKKSYTEAGLAKTTHWSCNSIGCEYMPCGNFV